MRRTQEEQGLMLKGKVKIIAVVVVVFIIVGGLALARYLMVQEGKAKAVLGHIETGHGLFLKGDHEGAYNEYLKAWQIKPEITNQEEKTGAVNLAQILFHKGKNDEAKDILLKVAQFDPYFYASYLFLGSIYLKENNPQKAQFYLEKGMSLHTSFIPEDPNTALLYYNLAEAYAMQGNTDIAIKNYKLFISMAVKDERLSPFVEKAKAKIK